MIELEAAVSKLKERLRPQTQVENIPLADCVGRITGAAVTAAAPVPAFPRAAMDGYAVAAESTVGATEMQPAVLKVIGTLYAGDDPEGLCPLTGEAVRVMTGAALPPGTDSVVPQEWTDYGSNRVQITREITRGKHYVAVGEDLKAYETIMEVASYLSSESLGVLASIGCAEISVKKKLRVGIIATGSELAEVGTPLKTAQVYNSTAYVLASYIQRSGGEVVFQTICEDDPRQFAKLLQTVGKAADLIITTGGVSVGQKDFLPTAIIENKGEILFHFVAFKPGTPVMGAVWEGIPLLCLSGNPFAALVDFHLFYWPLAAHFYRAPIFELKKEQQQLRSEDLKSGSLRRFISGYCENGQVTIDKKPHRVSRFQQILHSNCLVEQPPQQSLQAGQQVTVYRWFQGG